MSDVSAENKEQLTQEEETDFEESIFPTENVTANESNTEAEKAPKKKLTKRKMAILSAIAAVAIIIIAIALIPSKFDRVERECVQIAGRASSGKGYFSIDTYPDEMENMDATMKALLLPQIQENALKAIQYANDELGFPGSVYSQMLKTTALMGRQTEETSKYKVTWSYHPDNGLEVTYTKK